MAATMTQVEEARKARGDPPLYVSLSFSGDGREIFVSFCWFPSPLIRLCFSFDVGNLLLIHEGKQYCRLLSCIASGVFAKRLFKNVL